jgi:ABC-2 type transport system ATP-binding protein
VGVMSVGRLVASGTLAEVTAGATTRARVECRQPAVAAAVLTELGLSRARTEVSTVDAELGSADPEHVLAALVAAGAGVRQFLLARARLEDLFVGLTGEGFDVRG